MKFNFCDLCANIDKLCDTCQDGENFVRSCNCGSGEPATICSANTEYCG